MAYEKYKTKAGVIVPRCTSIIGDNLGWNKNALVAWARREAMKGNDPTKLKDDAALTGTITHELIEDHIYGVTTNMDKWKDVEYGILINAMTGRDEYVDWEKENKIEYLESEYKIVSEELLWGGTADAIAMVNSTLTLIDFKTSTGVFSDHIIQVAAYKNGLLEEGKYIVDNVDIIHIKKGMLEEGSKRVVPHRIRKEALEHGFEMFKMLRRIHDIKKPIETWEEEWI